MSRFDTQFKTMGFPSLLDQFGEPIVYCPRDGEEREIMAIVNRTSPTSFEPVDHASLPAITVSVFNDDVKGISSVELDRGKDRVKVSREKGRPAKSLKVMTLEEDDGGVCEIGLR